MKENFKTNETYQNFLGEEQSDPQANGGNVTLIHPMNYKPQILIDEVLQCAVDKYVIHYQNIWGEGMVTHHLVEWSYCKILVPL